MTPPDAPKITFIVASQEQADGINTWITSIDHRADVDPEIRAEVADQIFVRQELHELASKRHAAGTLTDRDQFARMADKVIDLARYAGIFASLRWMDATEADLDAALERARAQRSADR